MFWASALISMSIVLYLVKLTNILPIPWFVVFAPSYALLFVIAMLIVMVILGVIFEFLGKIFK